MNNLMICSRTKSSLHLNESANGEQKYFLEGVFAELDVLNRNQRVYKKDEYLKHLQYLRNDIKNGEPLLGELDHPEDRFEVKLKEASHQVLDLWYDSAKNVVMGKIMLLNTPNGKLAQSMVDQGIPLHISSRAAGSVASDNTVSIQQIYTYDLVCKPGFAGAVLHRVNESADAPVYDDSVKTFLSNSYKLESMNAAPQYGFLNEEVSVSEIKAPVILRKEAKELQINKQIELNDDMSKPLLETANPDSTVGKPLDISGNGGAAALGIPVADVNTPNESEEEIKDTDKDEEKKCDKCGKTPCECDKANEAEDEDPDDSDDDKSEEDDKESEEESKEDSGVKILDVEAEFEDEEKSEEEDSSDDMIKDVEASSDSDEKEEDEESEETDEEEEEEDETSEAKEDAPTDKDDAASKEAEKLNDSAKKDIEKHKEQIFKKLDDLKATIEKKNSEKKESKCESIIMAQYPVSMMMTESNFAKFASLSESQKSKVVAFLQDNKFTSQSAINENWQNGIEYNQETPTWLKYAPSQYKALYEAASPQVQSNLAVSAKYFIFESQSDINTFWENSGLVRQDEQRILNESFVNALPKVTAQVQNTSLPYGMDFINQIADMASEYNRKY